MDSVQVVDQVPLRRISAVEQRLIQVGQVYPVAGLIRLARHPPTLIETSCS